MEYTIVTFLIGVTKISEKQHKKGGIYFGTHFKDTVHYGGKNHCSRSVRWLVTLFLQSRSRDRSMLMLSSLYPFYLILDSNPWSDAAQNWGESFTSANFHWHAQRLVSYMIINPVKLTI